jgi:hypothetical protein
LPQAGQRPSRPRPSAVASGGTGQGGSRSVRFGCQRVRAIVQSSWFVCPCDGIDQSASPGHLLRSVPALPARKQARIRPQISQRSPRPRSLSVGRKSHAPGLDPGEASSATPRTLSRCKAWLRPSPIRCTTAARPSSPICHCEERSDAAIPTQGRTAAPRLSAALAPSRSDHPPASWPGLTRPSVPRRRVPPESKKARILPQIRKRMNADARR